MIEYKEHLDRYQDYWLSSLSNYIADEEWGDRTLAESYLQKYWLPKAEYDKTWRSIQEKVFLSGVLYPDMVFRPGFHLMPQNGGSLYSRESFEQQRCALARMNEQCFVVVQVRVGFEIDDPPFRMKYPASLTWEEMMSGNYISSVIAEREFDDYYVFGERGDWGMLVNGGPYDFANILAFRSEHSRTFVDCFPREDDLPPEQLSELPQAYQLLRS